MTPSCSTATACSTAAARPCRARRRGWRSSAPAGRQVLVLTNSATHETALTAARYRSMGFDFVPEEIVSSRDVAAAALACFEPGLLWGVATDAEAHLAGLPARLIPLRDDPQAYEDADAVLLLSGDDWTEARQARLIGRPGPAAARRGLRQPRPRGPALQAGLTLEPRPLGARTSRTISTSRMSFTANPSRAPSRWPWGGSMATPILRASLWWATRSTPTCWAPRHRA